MLWKFEYIRQLRHTVGNWADVIGLIWQFQIEWKRKKAHKNKIGNLSKWEVFPNACRVCWNYFLFLLLLKLNLTEYAVNSRWTNTVGKQEKKDFDISEKKLSWFDLTVTHLWRKSDAIFEFDETWRQIDRSLNIKMSVIQTVSRHRANFPLL
jgi:hypothetical protein